MFLGLVKDDKPSDCGIKEKRIDLEWGPWSEEIDVDNNTDFRRVETRVALEETAHGGSSGGIDYHVVE